MLDLYVVIIILLFVLAISDLIVGVSNDAVNFLNSAIGSKVTSRRNIMIVASLGILVGATFSSGMMEVARKGIFNPEYFFFSEIMVIFIAVMITDIILLDLFNTFGMPTSTTVSIVFELLGAAVAVSLLKINTSGESLGSLGNYINSSSALVIVSGIFISILIAFSIGSIIQYFSRLLFTFHIAKKIVWAGIIWSGAALTALTYFLLIKGIRGASFISDEFIAWMLNNTSVLLAICFVLWSIILSLLHTFFKVNILRIVVLFGTFALAMAFAGNDLVNFIGVPIAGFESFLAWKGSGVEAENFSMSILTQPVRTKTYMLLIAGTIMIITLWFSKKARSVTETEVNLGRQDEGAERFKPNVLAKGIVRHSLSFGNSLNGLIPETWSNKAQRRFRPLKKLTSQRPPYDAPAFDLVRASVNLTVASALIAFATSLKLPLSTTYVSFMVAMGTSLADKAWGRSSAVYRIAGVISVIGGWIFTAIMAFTAAAVFATFIYYFDIKAIGILILLAIVLISRTFILHQRKEKQKADRERLKKEVIQIPLSDIVIETSEKIGSTLQIIRLAYTDTLTGLLKEDRKLLQKSKTNITLLKTKNEELKRSLFDLIKAMEDGGTESSRLYLSVYDMEQDIVQSISLIVDTCSEYVANSMDPVQKVNGESIRAVITIVERYLSKLIFMIASQDFDELPELLGHKSSVFAQLEKLLSNQIQGIQSGAFGMRNSVLIFNIFLESKDLVTVAAGFAKLYDEVQRINKAPTLSVVTDK
ncbi:MAG: inorganic phosphate transporter [Saonia sp.]